MSNSRISKGLGTALLIIWSATAIAAGTQAATPMDTEIERLVAQHSPSKALLTKDTIKVQTTGTIAINFGEALDSLGQTKLIERIQAEYARTLPPGTKPEFAVIPLGSNVWTFSNKHAERSEIHKVAIERLATNQLMAVFYTCGERYFGTFESLTAIRISSAGKEAVAYEVVVLAYPHQALCRFFARHLGLVDSYFQAKTKEIETLATAICRGLCGRKQLQSTS